MQNGEKITKVALIGLGAIGSFLASGLSEVLGENLRVIAGGERKKRLEEKGVIINGTPYHFHIVDPKEDMKGDYPQLAIIITKFTGLEQALKDIKNQIGPDTLIMAPLNGVEAEEAVASVYGWDNLLYSLTRVSVVMKDGEVSFEPGSGRMEFGEKKNPTVSPRVQAVCDLFESAGIRPFVPEDMEWAIWCKYMCNVSENQTCAILGVPFGAFHRPGPANEFRKILAREVIQVANRKGINLSEEDLLHQGEILKRIRAENKPSTLQDLEAGRRTEVEIFSGAMIRLGKELGVPVPCNELCYQGIRALEEKCVVTKTVTD